MHTNSGAYWRSKEEVSTYLQDMALTRQAYSSLTIPFTTTAEFIQRILPPCFQPPETPRGMAVMGLYRSSLAGFYTEARICFACRYEGRDAWYTPAGYTSEEYACYTAREVRGYPFKHGIVNLMPVGHALYASTVRHGIGSIERVAGEMLMEASVSQLKEAPARKHSTTFVNIGGTLQVAGDGFEHPPVILVCTAEDTQEYCAYGDVDFKFLDGTFDALSEIPVVSVDKAVYAQGYCEERVSGAAVIEKGQEQYLKYYFGTKFDNLFCIPMSELVNDEVVKLYEYCQPLEGGVSL